MVLWQVEKDVNKAISVMEEVEVEIGRKKEVSRRVKGLREQISAAKHEAGQLTAEQQHLRRQQSSLHERIQRLLHQVCNPSRFCIELTELTLERQVILSS